MCSKVLIRIKKRLSASRFANEEALRLHKTQNIGSLLLLVDNLIQSRHSCSIDVPNILFLLNSTMSALKQATEVWCLRYDVWGMMYEIWGMHYDVWCMHYDVWCMSYDVWCMSYKVCVFEFDNFQGARGLFAFVLVDK